ncbi:MAG TPA: rhomboid family intramembrane serine protease, partial [Dissulfurispiraceae bacterium]|nr:rhomboid family intramembrane serine protease [Dissulfurispiraceae bacterium]
MLPIRDTVPNRTFPATTWIIIILCGVVFLFETTLPQAQLEKITYYFGIVPVKFTKRHHHGLSLIDYVSFLTTMFLHGGWLHILGNMWFLKIFG